jgi:peptidoglycan hydrolase-like protein with peptidoglycan-binding domain
MIRCYTNDGEHMIYDVGASVGAGGYNDMEDTMLVQYFMHWYAMWLMDHRDTAPGLFVRVDGLVGPKTREAIRTYQRLNGFPADGRVDPGARTIIYLNADFDTCFPNLNSGAPTTWPTPPPLLAAALNRASFSREDKSQQG